MAVMKVCFLVFFPVHNDLSDLLVHHVWPGKSAAGWVSAVLIHHEWWQRPRVEPVDRRYFSKKMQDDGIIFPRVQNPDVGNCDNHCCSRMGFAGKLCSCKARSQYLRFKFHQTLEQVPEVAGWPGDVWPPCSIPSEWISVFADNQIPLPPRISWQFTLTDFTLRQPANPILGKCPHYDNAHLFNCRERKSTVHAISLAHIHTIGPTWCGE